MDHVKESILSEEEKAHIESTINEKLHEMGRMRDFFGSGHGVNVVALMASWIEREIVPHERRLGIKLRYSINTLPGGTSRFIITGARRWVDEGMGE
jgi:hypothetical protein